MKPKEKPVVQLVKPLTPVAPQPVGSTTEFESGFMTGYERGIAAEREILMREFEHKHQMEPFESTAHHESDHLNNLVDATE